MARARKQPSSSVKINFKGVESRRTPPEGDYPLVVLEATMGVSSSKNDQIEFILEISKGEYKGTKLWFYCPLAENSLWKLHAFLTALGENVPEDEMDVDLSDLVGREVVGVLAHETYQGKKRAKMTDFDSIDNYGGDASDEEEEEKLAPKKGKAAPAKKAAAPDLDDMDEDELRELYLEKKLGNAKGAQRLDEDELREVLEEAAEEADEEEEEKLAPKKGKAAPAKKAAAKKKQVLKSDVLDMDEDELQELLEEHDLEDEVDLDDYKKLPKKVAAVIKTLEEADLLDDDDD
jgi:hypothetical protein